MFLCVVYWDVNLRDFYLSLSAPITSVTGRRFFSSIFLTAGPCLPTGIDFIVHNVLLWVNKFSMCILPFTITISVISLTARVLLRRHFMATDFETLRSLMKLYFFMGSSSLVFLLMPLDVTQEQRVAKFYFGKTNYQVTTVQKTTYSMRVYINTRPKK